MPIWTLYKRKILKVYTEYAWVCDGVIGYNRCIAPFGWLPMTPDPLKGLPAKGNLKPSDGWRKATTKATQEQLSKGYL